MTNEAIEAAIEKFTSGALPDSNTAGVQPARTETLDSGYRITEISYFKDGSISTVSYPDFEEMVAAVERGEDVVAAKAGSSGCKYMYTSVAITWTNCIIEGATMGVSMAYRVNATMVRGQSAKLTKAWDKQSSSIGGSLAHVSFGLISSTAARYQVMYTSYLGIVSYTRTLSTQIASGGALTVKIY